LIRLSLPIRKYRRDPRKGKKMIIRTHMILSLPRKSFIKADINASSGKRKMKRTTAKVIIRPPPKRKRKFIVTGF